MFWILMMLSTADFHFVLICSLKLSCESRYAPKYLTVEHLFIVSLMTLIVFSLHFLSCCPLPKYMNSVLDLFNLSLTASIHALMSLSEDSRIAVVSCSCPVPYLNCLHIEWLSANPGRMRSFFTTSWIVETYAIKRKAPCTDPWGTLKLMVFSLEYEPLIETLNLLGIR